MAVPFGYHSGNRMRPSQMMGDDRDIFERIAHGTLSNLSKVGNVLDLFGSSVRDVLAAENPFDQWLTPTTDANRTSGRELLEGWGVLDQNTPGLDWGDAAGVGAEVVFDPFFWIAGPSRALTTAGTVAQRANILGDVAKLTGRSVGPRAGRISTTLSDVLTAFPERVPAAQRAAEGMGVSLDAIKHERLGGLAAFGPPVGNPWAVFGVSDSALPAATVLDNIGSAIRWSAPVRAGYQLFGGGSLQTGTRIGQETANAAVSARNAALAESRHARADISMELQRRGVLPADPFEAGNYLFEQLEGITPSHPEIADLVTRMRSLDDSIYDDGAEWGVRREQYSGDPDIKFHWARYKAGTGKSGSSRPFNVADNSGIMREDILRGGQSGGIRGGSATLRRLAKDVGTYLDNAKAAGLQVDNDVLATHIASGGYGHLVDDAYDRWLPQQAAFEPATGRHLRLAKTLRKAWNEDPDILRAGFYTDPITSFQRYTERALDVNETGKAVLQTLADPEAIDIARRASTSGEEIPVVELLDGLKFDLGAGQGKGAIAKLAQLTGQAPADVATMTVPRELADDLRRMTEMFSGPEPSHMLLQAYDNFTAFTKAGQTAIWPAFHARNTLSAMVRNAVAGMFSFQSVNDMKQLLQGEVVRDAASIPIIRKTLLDRGQQVTDETATDVLREFVYAHGMSGSGQGEAFARAGAAAASPQSTMDGVLSQFPGGFQGSNPFSARQVAKQFAGMEPGTQLKNPFSIRGIGNRTASTFGPVVAGESLAEGIEGLVRGAPFIHQLRQGIDPGRAAERVLAAQIDYSSRNFSKFETQVAQRLFPYWRFNARNVPFVLNELLERPGGLTGQMVRVIDSMRDPNEVLPEHIAQTAAIPLGESPDGTQSYLTGFGLMEEAAMQFAPFDVRDTLQTAGSQLNPVWRAPVEYAFNQSLFYGGPEGGRDLEDLDPPVGRLLSNVEQTLAGTSAEREPYRLPQAVEFLVANSPLSRAITTGRMLFDPRKSAVDRMMNFGTGFRNTDVSPGAQDRVLSDALGQIMREDGARVFEKLYFAGGPDTPNEAAMMALSDELRQRRQERKQRQFGGAF